MAGLKRTDGRLRDRDRESPLAPPELIELATASHLVGKDGKLDDPDADLPFYIEIPTRSLAPRYAIQSMPGRRSKATLPR
jgi:hypothetical protein